MTATDSKGLDSFFDGCSTRRAINEMAGHHKLTLVVGAGVSRESGLPGWSDLLNTMLQKAARTSPAFRSYEERLRTAGEPEGVIMAALEREAQNYAQLILGIHGLIGAASVVKSWLPQRDFDLYLKQSLYGPVSDAQLDIRPGRTALEIARLWRDRGPQHLTTITTNYDLLIESALLEIGINSTDIEIVATVHPPVEENLYEENLYRVVHLHGVVPHRSHPDNLRIPDSTVVLAEDDYFHPITGTRSDAARDLCDKLLQETTCLFVGTSLTDPDLVTYLYGSSDVDTAPRHYSLHVHQGDQPLSIDAGSPALEASRSAMSKRLRSMGVHLLNADYFCQSALFIGELRHQHAKRNKDDSNPTHVERLKIWRDRAVAIGILPGSEAFAVCQPTLQRALAAGVQKIQLALEQSPLYERTEMLSLQLWAHDPSDRSLVLVGRSDQRFFNSQSLERHPIGMPVKKLVVEAVCSGSVLEAEAPDLASSRWGSMLVVPITLDGAGGELSNLPVGALVLASDLKPPAGLTRLRELPNERSQAVSALAQVGSLLLDPGRWSSDD